MKQQLVSARSSAGPRYGENRIQKEKKKNDREEKSKRRKGMGKAAAIRQRILF
jgi:hypothetical protein